MQWFLKKMQEQNAEYDAFCVFDADNIVDKEFMKAMNKKLCQGEEVVQGYRDIKNHRYLGYSRICIILLDNAQILSFSKI